MPAEPNTALLEQKIAEVQPSDIATLVYTSGTTGKSKGVVLRHHHLISALLSSSEVFPLYSGDRSIVYLPLAHILQRFVAYRALVDDIEGSFAPDLDSLAETIRYTRPHVLVAVPRVLEKILEMAASKAMEKGRLGAGVFRWAMHVAQLWGTGRGQYSRRIALQHRIASRLVYSKIHAALGGHLRCILSGAAPLSPSLAAQFRGIGIQIVEGWGLTESCGPATLVHPNEYQLGSVGKAINSISLRVSNDGEIQLQGESLFDEYWNNPEATEAAFTEDGWFRTGDLGVCDPQGYVWITGRSKDLIVTAGGKNIAPYPIEDKLRLPGIEQAIVLGDGRPYLICLFALEEAVVNSEHHQQRVAEHVAFVNRSLPRFSQIKKWAIVEQRLTPENGLLTPTFKPKRALLQTHFADLINSLYS
jgi:long-chain acyl-CoA synthetase